MNATIAYRTHVWDADTDYIARRIAGHLPQHRLIVLADETNRILHSGAFGKVSHTADFSRFGLPPGAFGPSLWYNGDYPLYSLLESFPGSTHFLMIENDVLINFDLQPMLDRLHREDIDLVVHNMKDADPDWTWYRCTRTHFDRPMQCLFPFLAISRRAAEWMLSLRQQQASRLAQDGHDNWCYCEGFIPSAVMLLPNARIAELGAFCRPVHYNFDGMRHYVDPDVNQSGTISHPVSGRGFLTKAILHGGIDSVFQPYSPLRRGLGALRAEDFYDRIYRAMREAGDYRKMMALNTLVQ